MISPERHRTTTARDCLLWATDRRMHQVFAY